MRPAYIVASGACFCAAVIYGGEGNWLGLLAYAFQTAFWAGLADSENSS